MTAQKAAPTGAALAGQIFSIGVVYLVTAMLVMLAFGSLHHDVSAVPAIGWRASLSSTIAVFLLKNGFRTAGFGRLS